jgi:hypothetical protein
MKKFLILYLIVTGVGGAIVLVAPWLVIIGAMALIVPGIILGALPSAFLYGACFALVWFPLQRRSDPWLAAGVAALVTFTTLYLVPVPGNRVTAARHAAELASDIDPPGKIALAGHVRIDNVTLMREPGRRAPGGRASRPARPLPPDHFAKSRSCGPLCAALLFTPGVLSVTVNDVNEPADEDEVSSRAVTFRRVPRATCEASLIPGNDGYTGWPDTLESVRQRWALRLSTSDCIVGEPPAASPELRIVASRIRSPLRRSGESESRYTVGGRPVSVERLEIFAPGGDLLLRRTEARASVAVRPLLILPEGDMSTFAFGVATKPIGPRHSDGLRAAAVLLEHTTLSLDGDTGELPSEIRSRLRAVVADASVPKEDAAFRLVRPFFDAMSRSGVEPSDVALVRGLIADPRVGDFGGIHQAIAALGPNGGVLRDAIVARIRSADPGTSSGVALLGSALASMPAGIFAEASADESALLRDVERRGMARGLIVRQADRGGAAASPLADMIAEHLSLAKAAREDRSRRTGFRDNMDVVHAARDGLCRIGRAGSSVLAFLDALDEQGLVPPMLRDDRAWQFMLARLGKPIETIGKPDNLSGDQPAFHARLRARLAGYRGVRDCS